MPFTLEVSATGVGMTPATHTRSQACVTTAVPFHVLLLILAATRQAAR